MDNGEEGDREARPTLSRGTDDSVEARAARTAAGRFAWLKHPSVAVALITVAGTLLVAVINQVSSGQDPETPAVVATPGDIGTASSATGSSPPSSPTQPDSSTPSTSTVGRWIVEDESVSVSASYEPYIFPFAGSTFLMPADGIAPSSWPNHLRDPEGYARDHGGFPAGIAAVQLVIRAKTDEPVVITSIVPQVLDRRLTPSAGYAVRVHYGCGGIPLRAVLADFDADPVTVEYDAGEGGGLTERMILNVTPSDPAAVVVNGMASRATIAWDVLIRYDSSVGTGELVVDQNSAPFVTSDVQESTPVWDYNEFSGLTKSSSRDPYGYC